MISDPVLARRKRPHRRPDRAPARRPHVDPRQVVEARVVGRFLAGEVVVRALPEGIRQRELVQQREPVAVQPIGRNDVAGKAPGAAGRRAAWQRGGWILDEDQGSVVVERLREVALTLERGGHPVQAQRPRLLHLRRLERVEEEQFLVGALIVDARNLHRAAEIESGRVDVERGLRDAGPIVLPRRGVPGITLAVPVRAAVIVGAPALADDLDVGAARMTELRLVAVQQHLDLRDRIEIDRGVHPVGARELVAVQAVDGDLIPVLALAADVRDLRSEAVAHRLDIVLVVHARQQPEQIDDVAAPALDLRDLLRREEPRVVAVLRLDRAAFGGDRHHLGHGADIELERSEVQLPAGIQDVIAPLGGSESGKLHPNGVRSGIHGAEGEFAALARDGGPGAGGGFVGERHRGARHHLTGIVDDGPGDRAGVLGDRRTRRHGDGGRCTRRRGDHEERRQDGAFEPHEYKYRPRSPEHVCASSLPVPGRDAGRSDRINTILYR